MRLTRRKSIIASSVLVVLLTSLFIFRGWIRGTLVPSYVNHFYKPSVNKHFDQDLAPVNSKLSDLGFQFEKTAPPPDECTGDMFRRLSQTIVCFRDTSSVKRPFTSDFVAHWNTNSPAFEKYLLNSGWHKEWNALQPINEIYKNLSNDASVAVNYSKTHGKVSCTLSVVYDSFSDDQDKTRVEESCSRYIEFFGGY